MPTTIGRPRADYLSTTLFALLVGIAATLTAMPDACAQDNHYNTHAYGGRAALMGGAMIGGVRDTSAIYYNPGAMGFLDNPSLSVSGSAYRFGELRVNDGAGTGDDLVAQPIEQVPLLISGVFLFEELPRHVFGYALIARQWFSFSASARRDTVLDILAGEPGDEDYIAQFTSSESLNEFWAGLNYAFHVDDSFAIGATMFLVMRTQQTNSNVDARAVAQSGVVAAVSSAPFVDFFHLRGLFRIGAAWDYGWFRAGVTFTTPSFGIGGEGTVAEDLTVVNVDLDADMTPDSFVANDRQSGLSAHYESPLSIGAGVEFYNEEWGTTLAVSVEWHMGIDSLIVIQPESAAFLRPASFGGFVNSADLLQVQTTAHAIGNVSVGIQQRLTDELALFVSFRTDHTYWRNLEFDGIQIGTSTWDLYHFTVGVAIKTTEQEITVGLSYSVGRTTVLQPVNFANPSEATFLLDMPNDRSLSYDVITLSLGYTHFL